MRAGLVGALAAFVVILVVLRLVARRRLLVKYAVLWLMVSVILVVVALIPNSLAAVSSALGFVVPANLLFFGAFVLLLFVPVQLSVELTEVEARVQRLAEEVAILGEAEDRADSS